jgi:tetratricopeptide (TPR) repeat protein
MRALLVVLALTTAASAQPSLSPEAKKHQDAGLALFDKGKYDEAIAEFEAAYKIEQAPKLLFAIAQAKRLGGHCDEAMPLYKKYLETLPSETQTEAAQTGMKMCADEQAAREKERLEREREKAEAQPPDEPTPPEPPPPVVAPPVGEVGPDERELPPPPERKPWYRRHPIGAGLVAGGIVSTGVGIGFMISSNAAKKRAQDEELRDDFLNAIDRANSRRRIGIGAIVAGALLATAGVLEIVLRGDGDEPDRTIAAGTDGTTIYLRAAF